MRAELDALVQLLLEHFSVIQEPERPHPGRSGIGGLTRGYAVPASRERARIAVRKAIRRAIGAGTAGEGVIGGLLESTIIDGATCGYTHTSDRLASWLRT